jgi:microcystin degradation protein MlrC
MSVVVLVVRFSHETNTFARPFTKQEDFFDDIRGTGAEAFVEECASRSSVEVVVSCIATANPSGPVEHDVFEHFAERIVSDCQRVKPSAVLLDLHGAMVTTQLEDGEGELLRRVRAVVCSSCPVGVCLDLHGNITRQMVDNSDVMACFQVCVFPLLFFSFLFS